MDSRDSQSYSRKPGLCQRYRGGTPGKVYPDVQLLNSIVGLLILPHSTYISSIPKTSLKALEDDGWPIPTVVGKYRQVRNLREMIRYLRNAVAHSQRRVCGRQPE